MTPRFSTPSPTDEYTTSDSPTGIEKFIAPNIPASSLSPMKPDGPVIASAAPWAHQLSMIKGRAARATHIPTTAVPFSPGLMLRQISNGPAPAPAAAVRGLGTAFNSAGLAGGVNGGQSTGIYNGGVALGAGIGLGVTSGSVARGADRAATQAISIAPAPAPGVAPAVAPVAPAPALAVHARAPPAVPTTTASALEPAFSELDQETSQNANPDTAAEEEENDFFVEDDLDAWLAI